MPPAPRLLAALALLTVAACRSPLPQGLASPQERVATARRIAEVLDRQGHYFGDDGALAAFERRLERVAAATADADAFYEGIARELARLDEGHTALVASSRVPFGDTTPPVLLFEAGGHVLVAGVAPGIESGGLRPGDLLLSVDGVPVRDALARRLANATGSTGQGRRARALTQLLAGPTNAPAVVRVRGPAGRLRETYPLRFLLDDEGAGRFRFGFVDPHVGATRLAPGIGYLALPDFGEGRAREAARALRTLGDPGLLVLDLRANPGGSIDTMCAIAGLFVDRPLGLVELHEEGRVEVVRVAPAPVLPRAKLRILVDARTGSAAELLAAGLRDLGRAEIVGLPTAGSTRTRRTLRLPGDVRLHYAGAAEFRRVGGARVEGAGVKPDVAVQATRDDLARGAYGDPTRDSMIRLAAGLN